MNKQISYHDAIDEQGTLLKTAAKAINFAINEAALPGWSVNEKVSILAMGASTNSAYALVAALRQQGINAENLTASDFIGTPAETPIGNQLLLVSESGRSPEPIKAARNKDKCNRIAITNYPNAAIAEVADFTIGYGEIEDSRVYTSGYISTLLSYVAVLSAVGLEADISVDAGSQIAGDALQEHRSAAANLSHLFDGARATDFVGSGMSLASAMQGALGFREALRIPASGWDTYQYIHGPIESMGPESVSIVFASSRANQLATQLANAGTHVILVGGTASDGENSSHLHPVPLTHQHAWARTIEETVVLQLLTDEIAQRQGIDVSEFLYSQSDTKLPEGA
jgi:fructoselysine-6-P-deglycase FrlB-like protein